MLNLLSTANNEYTYVISSGVTAFLEKIHRKHKQYNMKKWRLNLQTGKNSRPNKLIWAFLGIVYFFTTYTAISLRVYFIPATDMTV